MLLALLLGSFFTASGNLHAGPPPIRRVVLLLIPAVSAGDLNPARMPNFEWMTRHGAVGLMNSRTAASVWPADAPAQSGDPARGSAYLTLGAGTRCAAGPAGSDGYRVGERLWEGAAAQVYRRRNLQPAGVKAFALDPLLLQDENSGLGYRTLPGAVGDLLHASRRTTVVIGDADRPGEPHREGILAAMDSRGRVDDAWFDLTERNPDGAFGMETSLSDLDRCLGLALESADLVVVDWGDTARIDDERPAMLPARAKAAGSAAMARVDLLLGIVRRRLDFARDRLIVVSPYPSRAARSAFDLLCPALEVGGVPPGLLTSATTRRLGIVANVDVAPTLLQAFGITALPSPIVGRPFVVRPGSDAWDRLLATRGRLLQVERERRSLLSDLVLLLDWAMSGFILLFAIGRGRGSRWAPLSILFLPAALPPALFLLAPVAIPSVPGFATALLAVTCGLAGAASGVARIRSRATDALGVLALITATAVIADGLAGFPHMPYCILSYSLMEGARYYGIGNEYMGAFLAATAIGATALFGISGRRLEAAERTGVAALFVLATVVLAGPSYGAKFGGAIASAGAFGYCFFLLSGRRPNLRQLVAIGAGIAAVVAFVIVLDRLRGGGSSHVGRAFDSIRSGGLSELALILQRKGSMDLHLLVFSPWSRLMGLALVASILGLRSRWLRRMPVWPEGPLGAGIAGAAIAALIALLVDDAGALAAATALIFIPPALAAIEHMGPSQDLEDAA